MADDNWRNGLKKRIAAAGHSPRSLSLAAGLSPTAVGDILSGRSTRPRYQTLYRIAEVLGISIEALTQSRVDEPKLAPLTASTAMSEPPPRYHGDADLPLASPMTDVGAQYHIPIMEFGAATAVIDHDTEASEHFILPPSLARDLDAEDPICFRITDHALAPTFMRGDLILVDHGQTQVTDDGLYVLTHRNNLTIRRLQLDLGRETVSILSEDPHYPPIRDVPATTLQVFGRVVWRGHALR